MNEQQALEARRQAARNEAAKHLGRVEPMRLGGRTMEPPAAMPPARGARDPRVRTQVAGGVTSLVLGRTPPLDLRHAAGTVEPERLGRRNLGNRRGPTAGVGGAREPARYVQPETRGFPGMQLHEIVEKMVAQRDPNDRLWDYLLRLEAIQLAKDIQVAMLAVVTERGTRPAKATLAAVCTKAFEMAPGSLLPGRVLFRRAIEEWSRCFAEDALAMVQGNVPPGRREAANRDARTK